VKASQKTSDGTAVLSGCQLNAAQPKERTLNMPTKYPWHSTRFGETVYHNNTLCTEGDNIEPYYLAQGTGGKVLCTHCAKLNREGR
jgi:hypothetical protein